ncbi:MAG: V-type ATP synthase subunit E [Eubacterium sp.]|nr:V-type ATP synthase subunit E [Eubacterium sp.]
MSGLEKIRDRILHEAEETAAEKMQEAEAEARNIKSEAVRKADETAEDVRAKAENEIKAYSERVDSAIDLEHRTRILAAKQEIISDVINEARRRILGLSNREYFNLLLKLMEKNIRKGEGVIYFSEDDHDRIPQGFSFEVKELAKRHGGELSISNECRKIGPGFVLSYGGIEENCTLDALFAEKKDDLTDLVQTILFS